MIREIYFRRKSFNEKSGNFFFLLKYCHSHFAAVYTYEILKENFQKKKKKKKLPHVKENFHSINPLEHIPVTPVSSK